MKKKTQLLIIDDEKAILAALFRTLTRAGLNLNIDCITTLTEANELLKKNVYQVIITDYKMPLTSGLEFFKQIQQSHPETIRIILTGYSDLDMANDAIDQGIIHHYLEKPWDNDELVSILKKCICDDK